MKRSWLWKVACYMPFAVVLAMHGCGEDSPLPQPPVKTPPRFVEESSKGLPFRLYRDTKTKRLYTFSGNGTMLEINDVPSVYEQEVEK